MSNPICHFEIGVRDVKKAGAFYSRIFDWKLEEKQGQTMLRTGEPVGGRFINLILLGYGLPAVLAVALALTARTRRPTVSGPARADAARS